MTPITAPSALWISVPSRAGARPSGLMPTRQDLIDSSGAIARGTIVGSLLGILPGGGAVIASFAAYTFEKKMSKTPQRFGNGAIEGVAAPESANNAAAQTSFIPLLTLGIPPNAVMALMVGAMTIHGIVPGPQVMTKQPELFWGMIASMWLGNLMLVVINLPLVGVWVTLLRVPYRLLFPSIIVFCCIGVYSINNSPFDVTIAAVFGVIGYWLIKHDFEPAPMLLGFVLIGAAAISWGTTGATMALLSRETSISPLFVGWARLAIAAPCLLGAAAARPAVSSRACR